MRSCIMQVPPLGYAMYRIEKTPDGTAAAGGVHEPLHHRSVPILDSSQSARQAPTNLQCTTSQANQSNLRLPCPVRTASRLAA